MIARRFATAAEDGRLFAGAAATALASLGAVAFALSEEFSWAPLLAFAAPAAAAAAAVLVRAAVGGRGAVAMILAVILFFTDAALRYRGAGEIAIDWQSALKFLVWMGAGAAGVAWLPGLRKILARPGPALLLAYVIVCLFSALYAPSFVYSLGCALAVGALFVFAFAVTRALTDAEILLTVVLVFAIFLLISWVVFETDPALGASPFWTVNGVIDRFCGIGGQADNMGSICANYLGAIFLLWRMGNCRLSLALPFAALGAASLFASGARTAMIALAAGIGAVLLPRTRWGLCGATLGLALIAMASLSTQNPFDALAGQLSRSGDPAEISTLTGRLEIWDFTEREIAESPLLGYGYNSSKELLGQHLGFQYGLMIDTAHNLWLQNLLSVGILGTLPMAALFVWFGVEYVRRPWPFRDFYAVYAFVAGLADNQAFGTTPTVMMVLLFVAAVGFGLPSARGQLLRGGKERARGTPSQA
jgi:O-antigen ligase